MSKPLTLAGIYALAVALLQVVLVQSMPKTGMGAMAMTYMVWPLLAASVIGLYFLLKHFRRGRSAVFIAALIVSVIASVWAHPQDSGLTFIEKLQSIGHWVMLAS